MPQTPTTPDLDPDAIVRQFGGTISSPDRPDASAPDPEAIIRQFGGTITDQAPTTPTVAVGRRGAPISGTATVPTERPGLRKVARTLTEPFDPRTPEGRRNLAGTAGGIGMGAATGGIGVLPWIATALGAASAGGLAEAGEQLAGTKPVSTSAVAGAQLEQGALDLGGRAVTKAVLWPLERFKAAPAVAKQAQEWIEANLAGARGVAEDFAQEAITKGRTALRAVRASTRADLTAVKTAAASAKQQAAEYARGGVEAARKVYDVLAIAPEAAIRGAREGVAALTRTIAPRGVTQRALDIAGQTVERAAEQGPALPLKPVQTAIEQMLVEAHPGTIFQPEAKSTGIGFLDNLRARRTGEAAAGIATSVDQQKLTERIAKAMGVAIEDLQSAGIGDRVKELTNILGRVMTTKESQIPFKDAHRLKMLLDESVNWDTPAKKAMERITKGARQVLREQLAAHEPYNAATADYAKQVGLYRRGAGKALITAARDAPDRVVRLLNRKNPAAAQQIKDLIVQQSVRGGDPAAGLAAWENLQSAYIYDHITQGGVEGISQRLAQHLTEAPEFSRTLFDTPAAQQQLSNLDRISQAFQAATAQGEAGVAQAAQRGQGAVAAATGIAQEQRIAAREAVQDARRVAGQKGRAVIEAARVPGREFVQSTLAPFAKTRMIEDELVDIGVAATHPTSVYGARSIVRLMRGPSGQDLVQWAAKSDRNTQRLVAVLTSNAPPAVVSALARELLGVLRGTSASPSPVASHAVPTAKGTRP